MSLENEVKKNEPFTQRRWIYFPAVFTAVLVAGAAGIYALTRENPDEFQPPTQPVSIESTTVQTLEPQPLPDSIYLTQRIRDCNEGRNDNLFACLSDREAFVSAYGTQSQKDSMKTANGERLSQ